MGPAFRLASQIIISFTLFPVGVLAVKRSYATLPTTFPEVVWDQLHVDYSNNSNVSDLHTPTNGWIILLHIQGCC